jgi:peptide-methionine (S)-S-oxide reductase
MQKAIFAAGCFWGVEDTFRSTDGVISTRVGYAGGKIDNPTYEQVCSGRTGHAEAVEITFDEDKIGYEELLDVFWSAHNPTQKNRQGPDVGTQYRSAIFYLDDDQQKAAEASRDRLQDSGKLSRPIATEITEAGEFWVAEDYHQQYFERRGISHCRI